MVSSLVVRSRDEEGEVIRSSRYWIYGNEIKSITMLGVGQELEWELAWRAGLKIKTPKQKPCGHAYVFKIVRKRDF